MNLFSIDQNEGKEHRQWDWKKVAGMDEGTARELGRTHPNRNPPAGGVLPERDRRAHRPSGAHGQAGVGARLGDPSYRKIQRGGALQRRPGAKGPRGIACGQRAGSPGRIPPLRSASTFTSWCTGTPRRWRPHSWRRTASSTPYASRPSITISTRA